MNNDLFDTGALPNKLIRQLGVSHNWWMNDCEYMNMIYFNCRLINKDESDHRSSEHYINSSGKKELAHSNAIYYFCTCPHFGEWCTTNHFYFFVSPSTGLQWFNSFVKTWVIISVGTDYGRLWSVWFFWLHNCRRLLLPQRCLSNTFGEKVQNVFSTHLLVSVS